MLSLPSILFAINNSPSTITTLHHYLPHRLISLSHISTHQLVILTSIWCLFFLRSWCGSGTGNSKRLSSSLQKCNFNYAYGGHLFLLVSLKILLCLVWCFHLLLLTEASSPIVFSSTAPIILLSTSQYLIEVVTLRKLE